jgi:hypothetical protein
MRLFKIFFSLFLIVRKMEKKMNFGKGQLSNSAQSFYRTPCLRNCENWLNFCLKKNSSRTRFFSKPCCPVQYTAIQQCTVFCTEVEFMKVLFRWGFCWNNLEISQTWGFYLRYFFCLFTKSYPWTNLSFLHWLIFCLDFCNHRGGMPGMVFC